MNEVEVYPRNNVCNTHSNSAFNSVCNNAQYNFLSPRAIKSVITHPDKQRFGA